MDTINFVRPISRCDIKQDMHLITMRCNTKPKVKSIHHAIAWGISGVINLTVFFLLSKLNKIGK